MEFIFGLVMGIIITLVIKRIAKKPQVLSGVLKVLTDGEEMYLFLELNADKTSLKEGEIVHFRVTHGKQSV